VLLIFAAVIGSFLNVVIYRLPIMIYRTMQEECLDFLHQAPPPQKIVFNLLHPASHCPKCKAGIAWWQNIPIISFIFLCGRCHNCKAKISWRYPFIELLTVLSSLFVLCKLGMTAQAMAILCLTWGLIPLVFIDFNEQVLPDILLLPLLWVGLLLNTLHLFTTPENAILGAVSGYLSLWIISVLFKFIRKIDGMGNGDFKLFALFGAWFGWQILPFIILLASLVGAVIGVTLIICKKLEFGKPMPFGPYIIAAGWSCIFYGENITHWFFKLINLC